MKSQNARLIDYLEQKGSIQPLEAWLELGCYRLSARIKDLKDMGYNITKTMITVKNQFGEKCKVARYELKS